MSLYIPPEIWTIICSKERDNYIQDIAVKNELIRNLRRENVELIRELRWRYKQTTFWNSVKNGLREIKPFVEKVIAWTLVFYIALELTRPKPS